MKLGFTNLKSKKIHLTLLCLIPVQLFVLNFLKDNPEIALKIEQEIRSHGKENKDNEENEKIDVVEEEIAVD